jgi:hypothetical protein
MQGLIITEDKNSYIRAYNYLFREFGCSSYLFTCKEGRTRVQHYISQSHISKLTFSRIASGCCNAYYLQTNFLSHDNA